MTDMHPTICCAYLRVYRPLDDLPAPERERTERLLASPAPVGGVRTRDGVQAHTLGLIPAEERRPVYERVVDDVRYVCPSQLRLRALLAMVSFERTLPDRAVEMFFARDDLRAAHKELERLQGEVPGIRPYIVQSAWHVPLRWFVCFDDAERRIEQSGDHPRIRYETAMAKAQERVTEGLEVLEDRGLHPSITGMVSELSEWVSGFDPSCLLELDYASVSRLFSGDELADDHSARDVWESIEALASGDGFRASLYYQRATERWSEARAHESLN